jgi:hypothetical protein
VHLRLGTAICCAAVLGVSATGVADAGPIAPPPSAPVVVTGAPCTAPQAGDVGRTSAGPGAPGVFCAKAPGDPTLRWRPLDSSTHRLVGAIDRLSLAYFDRPIDPEGLAYWIDLRVDGVPLVTISEAFAASKEFAPRALEQDDFHDIGIELYIFWAYELVLGRQEDTAGFVYWKGLLKDGTIYDIPATSGLLIAHLSQSPEFREKTGTV